MQVHYVIADRKVDNIFKQNAVNGIVFKLQLFYSTVTT